MKKIVIGLIIIMLGAFLLFEKMGFFIPNVYDFVISWQTLLITIGIVLLFDNHSDLKTAGAVLVTIGTLFLVPKIFSLNIGSFIFPLLMIAAGIGFIIIAATQKNAFKNFETWDDELSTWKKNFKDFQKTEIRNGGSVVRKEYVFAASKEKWTQGKLKNVEIEAVFSGVELDFSQSELADDIKVAAYIKIKSVFSGVILYVPEDWNIMVQKTGVFGGFTDNRPNRVMKISSNKLVILELEAVFGGGEIKCYE